MRKYTAWALALCVSMVAVAQAAETEAPATDGAAAPAESTLGPGIQRGERGERGQRGERGERAGGMRRMAGAGIAGAKVAALKQMELTDEQKTKLETIDKTWSEGWRAVQDDMRKLRETTGTTGTVESREALAKRLTELNDKINADVDAMLTPEQKTKLEEHMKNTQNIRTRRMAADGNTTRPE